MKDTNSQKSLTRYLMLHYIKLLKVFDSIPYVTLYKAVKRLIGYMV